MERFDVRIENVLLDLTFSVAMGNILEGYCIVGPPEAIMHFGAVFEIFRTAFPAVREGYENDPENYNPLILLLTPTDHADFDGWDVQRVDVDAGFDFHRWKWTPDVLRALREAETLLQ